MKKTLLSGLFWILFANLLVKPFWILGIEVGVQNAVGTSMYGLYFAIFNLSYIFNILLDLGITNFNTRNIAQYPNLIAKHLSGILSIKLMLLALYLVVTFSVALLLGYDSYQFHLLVWLCVNQFLNSLIVYLRSNFEGLLLFKWDSLLSVMDRLLMIVICGFLLWGPAVGSFRIEWFIYAQTVAYVATAATALFVLARKSGLRRLHWNRPFTLAILKKSLPFALLVLLMASYNRLDPVMLQRLSPAGMGDYNAGIYAGAFRLLDALTMIAYLASVALLPVFSKLTKPQSDPQRLHAAELRETVRLMTSFMTVFAVTAACTLSALDDELMGLFYKDHVDDYASVFRIVIFCIIPISATYVYGTLLTAAGRLRTLNLFAATALLLNLVVNLICIPRWGAVGSAWAGLTAQSFMAVAQIVASLKLFAIRPSTGYILKILFFTLSIVACAICTPHLCWWTTLVVMAVVALGMGLLLRLVDIHEIVKIIKSE